MFGTILGSLNFCQLLNHEELVYQSAVKKEQLFTAPDYFPDKQK